ncbi:helix-turn-helix transcriptional regulator [Svornostia abyssi]|uniref:Helix-turn-helix transcriptional regulator n=1 Tax=Svornostia abyssi TaxID=2898438 RepID=A0ABY5PHR7_9ACTN|nr:helix-turn-helix transcriptional regulator [Parviterribacteraceae bacterium J379]
MRPEAASDLVERLALEPADPDRFFSALLDVLEEAGTTPVGACYHLTDPATGLFTWTGVRGELPGDFTAAVQNEYEQDDVAKYRELARRPRAATSLLDETEGRPEVSRRYREQLRPDGFADELRLAFADGYGRWGSMGLFADRAFTAAEVDLAGRLVPVVARALRLGVAVAAAQSRPEPGGFIVLDGDDHVVTRDERAGDLLGGEAETGGLPGVLHVVAAAARAEGRATSSTLGADGAWLEVEASRLVDGAGVALAVRPAPPPSLLELRLRAAGLTGREREIALAVLRGDDTKTIAGALHLSPWTVQDHLKAIFEKTGVRSRREFAGRWALAAA